MDSDEKKPLAGEEEKPQDSPSSPPSSAGGKESGGKKESRSTKRELEEAKKSLAEAQERADELEDKYLRMAAEYDNYRRRAREEKDALYADAAGDVLTALLPVLDNLERAAAAEGDAEDLRRGVKMTLTQFEAALEALGVTEVPCEHFDPTLHNAVSHIEDEARGEGEIVEVLQRGYRKGDRVLRYAMVKVAN